MPIGKDGREKAVVADEGFRLALELHVVVLSELFDVFRDACIEDGVELIPLSSAEVQRDEVFHLLPAVDLLCVEIAF
jgi:hypothetical protein